MVGSTIARTNITIMIVVIIFLFFLLKKFICFTSFLFFKKGRASSMRIPVFSAIILIFVVWLQYEIRKSSRSSKKSMDQFWDNEKASNETRKQSISDLELMTISIDKLPLEDDVDQTINSYRDKLQELNGKKMINLSEFTNTQLKSKYGVANLSLLIEYDNNFTTFVSISQKWAERFYSSGNRKAAKAVLEYTIACHTDIPKAYRLLAEIYHKEGTPEKIENLLTLLKDQKLHDKDKLIHDLTIYQ